MAEANKSITLEGGAILELQDNGFDAADELFAAFMLELAKTKTDLDLEGIDFDPSSGTELSQIGGKNLASIINVIGTIAGAKSLRAPMFNAGARCLYNGKRLEKSIFEDIDARPDFLPVAQEVIKFTLAPFFKRLGLLSLIKDAAKKSSQG